MPPVLASSMVLGHFGVAFAAKRVAPRVSLGWLLGASVALDLLWPILLILGAEHVRIAPGDTLVTPLDFYDYPITHSLLAVVAWSLLVGGVYFAVSRQRVGALAVGLLVASHWFLDAIVHRPDLPLYPGSEELIGLGLWNSYAATILVEAVLFFGGLIVYTRTTTPADRAGRYALWSFVIFFVLVYAGNLVGPPPPTPQAIGWVGLAQWLIVPWGWWIDAHRAVRRPAVGAVASAG